GSGKSHRGPYGRVRSTPHQVDVPLLGWTSRYDGRIGLRSGAPDRSLTADSNVRHLGSFPCPPAAVLDKQVARCILKRYSDAVNPEAAVVRLAHASGGANRETGYAGTR